jgi:hypothetical protein
MVTWAFTVTTSFCLWILTNTIIPCAHIDDIQLMQSTLRNHSCKPEHVHAT